VLDGDCAFLGPGGDAPVRCNAFSLPVELNDIVVSLAGFKPQRCHLFGTLAERVHAVAALLVNAVHLVRLAALSRLAPVLPGVGCDVNVLVNFRSDIDMVASAGCTAPRPRAIHFSVVANHQKVIVMPACGIVADNCGATLLNVVLEGHEKDTVVDRSFRCSCLFAQGRRPEWALIAVSARVALLPNRVSNLDNSGAVAELFCGENDVRVATLEPARVRLSTSHPQCRVKHHLVVDVVFH